MKHILYISFVIFFITSCGDRIPRENVNSILIKEYFEHFNNHNWEAMSDMYTADAEFKDPLRAGETYHSTKKELIEKYSALQSYFPNIENTIEKIHPAADNVVVVEFISKGKAVDGTLLSLPICTVFTIKKGKITKDYTYYDNF